MACACPMRAPSIEGGWEDRGAGKIWTSRVAALKDRVEGSSKAWASGYLDGIVVTISSSSMVMEIVELKIL